MGAGMLNIPEHVDPFRAFHVEQFNASPRVPVLQFFDLAPLEPETAATADTGMGSDTSDLHGLKFIITCWAIHRIKTSNGVRLSPAAING